MSDIRGERALKNSYSIAPPYITPMFLLTLIRIFPEITGLEISENEPWISNDIVIHLTQISISDEAAQAAHLA